MMVTTKGRYALRVMIDFAQQEAEKFIPLTEVARRQEISEKYLESIVGTLTRGGLLESARGKKGGYRLSRPAGEYTVKDILIAVEKPLAPVACLEKGYVDCPKKDTCPTIKMWQELNNLTDGYLTSVTLHSLAYPQN